MTYVLAIDEIGERRLHQIDHK